MRNNFHLISREWDGNMTVCVCVYVCVRVCVRASVVFQLALHTLIHSLTHTHWFEKFFISHHSDSILSCFLYAVTGRRMSVREERILLYACAVLRFLDEEREREVHYHD